MEKLTARIEELVAHWTKVQTDNAESNIKHQGAIEAAKIILGEIATMSAVQTPSAPETTLDCEAVPVV